MRCSALYKVHMYNLGFLDCFFAIAELNVPSSLLESEAGLGVEITSFLFSHPSYFMQCSRKGKRMVIGLARCREGAACGRGVSESTVSG